MYHDEEKYQKLLDKANADAEKSTGEKLLLLNKRIEALNKDLKEAHEKNQRAKSMAEQTKAGHVYIISNLGSFGEDIYKIGMTRRLEPLDRVKELGYASVPFIIEPSKLTTLSLI
ncbi:MAG TPA: GIY-YIG nuclease family protein [Bacteroidetes bacterium]|nr:GIY-YIG nuclease family protein [Bacteroidota bacterium]